MKQDTVDHNARPKSGMHDHAGFLWRFIRFALPFFSAEHKWRNRGWLALIAALTVAQVAVQVGLNSWSARLYNAIEGRHLDAFVGSAERAEVLRCACDPDPVRRFPSVAAFADAWGPA